MSSKKDDSGEKGSIGGGGEKEAGEEGEKTNITHLPVDVLLLIIVELGGGLSLTETNRYFYNVRRHLYLRLNRPYSRKYHEEGDFRIVVHSRVEEPSTHLGLS